MALNRPPSDCVSTSRTPGECWGKVPLDQIRALQNEAFGFLQDFLFEAEAADTLDGWTVTNYTTGDVAQSGDEGGWMRLLPNTSSQTNTGCQMQASVVYQANADTRMAFGFRVKATDGDKQTIVAGLSVIDADLAADYTSTTADMIAFIVAAGTIYGQCNTTAGGHTAVTTGETLGDATAVWLECFVDGADSVTWYVDGVQALKLTSSDITVPVDTGLAVSLANEATEDSNNYLDTDIAYAYQWRK